MNNLIIPVISEEQIAFIEQVKTLKEVKVIIGITENLYDRIKGIRKKNFVIKVYENGSKKEEIINAVKDQIDEGKVLICRKNISNSEIESFFNSNADITICSKKSNKFKDFFLKLWQKFMLILFDFNFFNGDVSVVCFNKNLFNTINNLSDLSFCSRINKWKGVEINTLDTENPPAKKEYDKCKANFMLYGWIFLFVAIITSTILYFSFKKATFLKGLLFASAILIVAVGLLIAIAIFALNVNVGQRRFRKAKIAKI